MFPTRGHYFPNEIIPTGLLPFPVIEALLSRTFNKNKTERKTTKIQKQKTNEYMIGIAYSFNIRVVRHKL